MRFPLVVLTLASTAKYATNSKYAVALAYVPDFMQSDADHHRISIVPIESFDRYTRALDCWPRGNH